MKHNPLVYLILFWSVTISCKKDKNPVVNPDNPIENPKDSLRFPYVDTANFITYNVAGLPQVLSSGDPVHNTSEIGRRLNRYDVVAVQEDFNYNHFLFGTNKLPYKTKWMGPVPIGDGLDAMSVYKISDVQRVKWKNCHGADCLTPKGFFYSKLELLNGVTIDFYNLHSNAGSEDSRDTDARRANLIQVFNYIQTHSEGRPVIVMGDFNSRYTRATDTLEIFYQLGFTDTWIEMPREGIFPIKGADALKDCDNPSSGTCETVDRILYRSNEQVKFKLLDFQKPRDEFQRDGADLSDHIPVSSLFQITINHR